MNLTSSHPFWSVNNGLPANYPSLQRNVSCDAVVVGGGITGALVAVHLAGAGAKTLLIDKRDIGTGSTSASTALLQYEIDVPLRALLKQVGSVAATRSGKKVSTPAAGNVATVNQLLSEEKAPEISFRVHDGLGIIQLHENWMN